MHAILYEVADTVLLLTIAAIYGLTAAGLRRGVRICEKLARDGRVRASCLTQVVTSGPSSTMYLILFHLLM